MNHSATRPGAGSWSLHGKIDLCRGVFAWMVAIAHALGMVWALHPHELARLPPTLVACLDSTLGAGFYWVMGFFVLSGFCIHQSVERRLASGSFPARAYLVARLTRILPLYYLALAFTLVVETATRGARPGIWDRGLDGQTLLGQLLMLQGVSDCFGSFTPSWSITNELFYYLAYGALAHLALVRPALPAWIGMISSVVLGLTFQAFYLSGFRSPWILKVGFLLGLGAVWFLGVLVAVERPRLRENRALIGLARAWPLLLLGSALLFYRKVPYQLIDPVCGVAFALMMVRFIATSPEKGPAKGQSRAAPVLRLVGLSSYPTYLFHAPLMIAVGSLMLRMGWVVDWRVTWLALSTTGIVAGLALGWYLERPLLAWRSRIMARVSDSPAVPSTRPANALGTSR